MKEKVVNKIMFNIKSKNNLDPIKLEEIKYGISSLYTLITKTSAVIILSIILGIFKEFILFLLFYALLRSVGFGSHAKSNIACWIFSLLLIFGIPFIFLKLDLNINTLNIIWLICFINYAIFCPADTEKRPMISINRKLVFKIIILVISIIYLIIMNNYLKLSSLIVSGMVLEALLTNPLGYILMGKKIRFRLNDILVFNRK